MMNAIEMEHHATIAKEDGTKCTTMLEIKMVKKRRDAVNAQTKTYSEMDVKSADQKTDA